MNKILLTALLLITLFAIPQTTFAAEKKFEGVWQKITLKNLLQQQANGTVSVEVKGIAATPTPTQRVRRTRITPTPTKKLSTPTPTKKPVTPTKTQSPTTAPATTNDVTAYIMKEINDYRASQGLGSVQTSTETCNFAKTRAQEIATSFNHDGFAERRDKKTIPYASWTAITENIAMTSNHKDVVTMWKNSSGHAANMRANTPYVCVMQHGNYYAYEGMKP